MSDTLLMGAISDTLLMGAISDTLLMGAISEQLLMGAISETMLMGAISETMLMGDDQTMTKHVPCVATNKAYLDGGRKLVFPPRFLVLNYGTNRAFLASLALCLFPFSQLPLFPLFSDLSTALYATRSLYQPTDCRLGAAYATHATPCDLHFTAPFPFAHFRCTFSRHYLMCSDLHFTLSLPQAQRL